LTGDAIEPIDFIFIGFRGQLDDIFGDAGWVSADSINFFTIWKIAYSSFFNQSYPTAPGTPSFWDSRPNDFSYEKPTSSVRKRQHIHIWKTPYTVNAQPLWVATAHFDRGLKLMNGLMPNHEIDPLIDNERDSLKDQLLKTGKIALLKKIKIVDPVLGQNQAGSIFYTDGKGYIVILKQ
jgi:undecaprenyl-diphosphatase